ncbi:DNA polymerase III subunit alpha [Lederbergia galactosidilytica]|uniref:DNA polymerase III subunit alpha n=1 Tax=Lederbergia galactosidilytica TaxID=217031 RepID=A0A177ZL84_9BACI|nr:DNA polymerase III subunit alpha [Lederbergia galactosidilytica]KRG14528.1 DNA polymerase III DnaE [Virgibacillus soli]OAK68209.1 DNA polymerase III DnaE [Lederbergia galactosidilytica]
MSFAHLQISTSYSLLSSTISIPALVEKARRLEYTALALTDYNVLYGVLPFYKACVKAGIKPIIGMTALYKKEENGPAYPLLLLAQNNQGYKNLLEISTIIKTGVGESILWRELIPYVQGLFALSPGKKGEIEQLLQNSQEKEAIDVAKQYLEVFGSNQFYLTVQNHHEAVERELKEKVLHLATRLDISLVATNDVQYLEPEEAFAQECLLAIRDGVQITVPETKVKKEYYFKSKQEMEELFSDLPEAITNIAQIVEACNVMVETNQELLPKYPLPEEENSADFLRELCESGLEQRIVSPDNQYYDRLNYELSTIQRMGFNDYFLIVWDFMKYAREHGILTGPGRGSAAGSLVAYLLGITDADPIKHQLLFERFLNPERISMPDIDIDFPDHRRDEVIEYVMKKYGRNHVAQIITFGTFAAKAAMRDTARVFGLTSAELEELSKLIPSRLGISLKQALQESDGLQKFVQQTERNRMLFETALILEGLPRHTSTHAAGVVIAEQPLTELIPLQGAETGTYLTQFPMGDLEEIGLLKMDFLGLRNLTLLEQIMRNVEKNTGKKLSLNQIPFTDEKTFALLQKGDTSGIFQLESDGMRKVLRELKPTEFEDIVAVNALFRPGPMENIPEYIACKHGKKQVYYPHPDLRPILELTYGVIVYQEQIMQIAATMAGFSLGEADLLRRAVSKKKKAELANERIHFVQGALNKGHNEQTANQIYDLIVRFANYGFNRSHAVAYSYIAWQLAYLKAHYPKEFMAALLTSVIGNDHKVAKYIHEAKQLGIKILPPSINASQYPFIATAEGIRFSLGAIKGIGVAALREITQHRKRPYRDLFDFCMRVSPKAVNRKVLEGLVYAGALDEFGYDRGTLLATLDVALEHAELMRPSTGSDLFADDKEFQIQPKYVEVDPLEMADKLFYEKYYLGLYISDHPTSIYQKQFSAAQVTPLIQMQPGLRNVAAGVYITNVKKIRTKKGDQMAFVKMSDPSGELEGVIFPEAFRKFEDLCQEGEVVLVIGNAEQRENHIQLIINRLQNPKTLKELDPEKRANLYIKIPRDLQQSDILYELRAILEKYSGETIVVLHYERTKRTIKLGDKDRVDPSTPCLEELKQLLGNENIVLK